MTDICTGNTNDDLVLLCPANLLTMKCYVEESCTAIKLWQVVTPMPLFTVYCFTPAPALTYEKKGSKDASLIANRRHVITTISETAFTKRGADANCFFTTGFGSRYGTSTAALLISSATCDGSKLQEVRLMLMCHHRGLLKTWFICLSTAKESLWIWTSTTKLLVWGVLLTCRKRCCSDWTTLRLDYWRISTFWYVQMKAKIWLTP